MTIETNVRDRARASLGTSASAIYARAAELLAQEGNGRRFAQLADIGCGTGSFLGFCQPYCDNYCGIDAVKYDSFPRDTQFLPVDLDSAIWPVEDNQFDASVSLETVEHLENPRAFFRQIARITRPGGLVIVTTPNQTSFLSKLTLLVKNEFNAFQERPGLYPGHRTALLPIDLQRIAIESGLANPQLTYSNTGRLPGFAAHWPSFLRGRLFSDNVLVWAHKR
jgi:SAM-dependent methyltransferase